MTDPPTVELRSGPSYLRFALGHPYAEFADYIPTTIALATGVFRGEFATSTWVTEWQTLREVLADLDQRVGQDSEARCAFSDQVRIDLTFKLARLGHLALRIELNLHERETKLEFWIDADQTFLPIWVRAIDKALARLSA